jgi:hypothetical protein
MSAPRRIPGSKYFCGRVIRGAQVLRYVVWDGIKDHRNVPPLQRIAQEEKITDPQVWVVDKGAVSRIKEMLRAGPIDCPGAGGVVVWARSHKVYRRIVERLTEPAPDCVWLM